MRRKAFASPLQKPPILCSTHTVISIITSTSTSGTIPIRSRLTTIRHDLHSPPLLIRDTHHDPERGAPFPIPSAVLHVVLDPLHDLNRHRVRQGASPVRDARDPDPGPGVGWGVVRAVREARVALAQVDERAEFEEGQGGGLFDGIRGEARGGPGLEVECPGGAGDRFAGERGRGTDGWGYVLKGWGRG